MLSSEDVPSGRREVGRHARIVFQPIVDLQTWRVVGFEALTRFADGTPPPVRLAEAEASGRRDELEVELIRAAVSASQPLPEHMFLTVNASGTTILRDELRPLLDALDRPWGIELYEGSTPADLSAIRAHVTLLGGQLLVDDAGASAANATRIRILQPDVVKIDRNLFWQTRTDPAAREQLRPLAEATKAANAQLLVEGVSDPECVDAARALGADLAQGYHLGMPVSAEEMPEMLRELRRSIGVDAPGL